MKKLFNILPILTALAVMAVSTTPAFARPTPAQNGTTLAAYKTIDICDELNANGKWTVFGEIAVWNEGAVDTVGLAITDTVYIKVGSKFVVLCSATILDPITEIPAGTTLATATIFKYACEITAGSVLATDTVKNTANITILNHSGSLGTPKGPSPSATWTGVFFCPDDGGSGCTYTQGYWGNKPDVIWPAPYDRAATFYLSGQTWQQVLDTPVNASQGYYQLAHQYIAAVLNVASGASVPTGVQTTLNLAAAWLAANNPSACTGAGSCGTQKDWAAILASYNEGTYPGGPSHCE
jgi:hypothetical protein